ncbi:MAG: carbohydrate porin [Chthoniobacterales bacterium]
MSACLLFGNTTVQAQQSPKDWWNGKYATGEWFGFRPTLEDHGIYINGTWRGTFYGIVDGGLSQRGTFDAELHFKLKLDFEELLGIPGLSAYGSVRWRDGDGPNGSVGASAAFNPSFTQVGKQWRLLPFYLLWESRDLLPVENMLTISGGWANPYFFFIQQPESDLFVNNAIHQTKGMVNNGFPWSGTYGAWGGHVKVKPIDWYYAQVGMYMAVPNALDTDNHGLYFEGASPSRANGFYVIGETGVTPKIAGLPGKYAFGGIYYGLKNDSFNGQPYDGRYTLYWQADQMLFREPASAAESGLEGKGSEDGKSFVDGKGSYKEVSGVSAPPSEQGLYMFNFISFSPKYNNTMPFYFHTGLVYKGLIPTRDKDQLGVAFACGSYSYYKMLADERLGRDSQIFEGVIEVDYRFQVTKFAHVQPFIQYVIRPGGRGNIGNATILGLQMGVNF